MLSWRQQARNLKVYVYALYLACRDPRVPWYAKAWCAALVAYALSPIDLIPDPIPVLGQLDDLIIIPLGVLIARRMITKHVMADCLARSRDTITVKSGWHSVAVIVVLWLILAVCVVFLVARFLSPEA